MLGNNEEMRYLLIVGRGPDGWRTSGPLLNGLRQLARFAVAAALSCVTAPPVSAARIEYVSKFDGERIIGSEVCFFAGGEDDGFFKKFLTSSDVRCLDGDSVIQMPLGYWNVFVNGAGRYTTSHPTVLINDEAARDANAYTATTVPLRLAATLKLPRPTAEVRAVVYFPNADQPDEPAAVRPQVNGRTDVLVPAETTVVPLLVRGVRIVKIGQPVSLPPITATGAVFNESRKGRRDVAILLRTAGTAVDDGDDLLDPLDVTLSSGKETHKPLLPVRTGRGIDRSLLIFRDVPQEIGIIVIKGRRWQEQQVAVPAGTDAVAQLPAIYVRRAGEIRASWTSPAVAEPCRLKISTVAKRVAPRTLVVERCAADGICREVATRQIENAETSGDVTFTGLTTGSYRLTLDDARLGRIVENAAVQNGRTSESRLELRGIRVFGAVTRGDEPVKADLAFVTGTTSTDESGRYDAVLASDPGTIAVSVFPCDGGEPYQSVPEKPIVDGSMYDIAIPSTEVNVRVSDATRGTPLANADVYVAVMSARDDTDSYVLQGPATKDDGTSTIRLLPPATRVRACAHLRDFKGLCSGPFTLAADERKDVRLALPRTGGAPGRVLVNRPVVLGLLYWISPDGRVTETRPVHDDGTFTYLLPHSAQEHLVLVAAGFPLQVIRGSGADGKEPLEVRVSPQPTRGFTIVPGTTVSARLALEIDGFVIPETVFGRYQARHRMPGQIQDAATVGVQDVAGAQIVLLVGPPTSYQPPGVARDSDLSMLPQFRATYRRFVVNGAIVQLSK